MNLLKLLYLNLIKNETRSIVYEMLRCVLTLGSIVYFMAFKLIDFSYAIGLRKIVYVNIPVISVGNLSLGGTGKTPMIIFLANYLLKKGMKPAVLIRGYGRDEYKMIEEKVRGAAVFKGQDRVKNALNAERQGFNMILVDDGFQHRRLGRDLDILLIESNGTNANKYLFPRGLLREPFSSIKRADMIILTKTDNADRPIVEMLENNIRSFGMKGSVLYSEHKPLLLKDLSGNLTCLEEIKDETVFLMSAIADPGYFRDTVSSIGAIVAGEIKFSDHYEYIAGDIEKALNMCEENNARKLIITEKDYVKIKDLELPLKKDMILVLDIELSITKNKEMLIDRLDSIIYGFRPK